MNRDKALEILGLDANPTISRIRVAYRRMAQAYHPDKAKTGDARKFLLAAAAYKILIGSAFVDADKNEKDLVKQASIIEQELDKSAESLIQEHGRLFSDAVASLREFVMTAGSRDSIKSRLDIFYAEVVKKLIGDLTNHYDSRLAAISSRYDDWISKCLRDSYREMMEKEFSQWRTSSFFWLHNAVSGTLAVIGGGILLRLDIPLLYVFGAFVVFALSGPFFYWQSVRKCFHYKENIGRLNRKLFGLENVLQSVVPSDPASPAKTATGGALVGALLGAVTGGKSGALWGVVFGAVIGFLMGQPLDEYKVAVWAEIKKSMDKLNDILINGFRHEMPRIKDLFLTEMEKNYQKNKEMVVKKLIGPKEKINNLPNTDAAPRILWFRQTVVAAIFFGAIYLVW